MLSSTDLHDLSRVCQARAYQIVGQQNSGPLPPVEGCERAHRIHPSLGTCTLSNFASIRRSQISPASPWSDERPSSLDRTNDERSRKSSLRAIKNVRRGKHWRALDITPTQIALLQLKRRPKFIKTTWKLFSEFQYFVVKCWLLKNSFNLSMLTYNFAFGLFVEVSATMAATPTELHLKRKFCTAVTILRLNSSWPLLVNLLLKCWIRCWS